MSSSCPHFIFLFLDGVGLGPPTPTNPLAESRYTPFICSLLGRSLTTGLAIHTPNLLAQPIDACLGVPGRPQSATGQTTLYTGRNAAQFRGQHQTGFANGSLRQLIERHSMFKQVLALGQTATLANLYSPAYFEAIAQRRLRYAVGTLLNLTARLPFRMQYEYEQEAAIFWDITGEIAHQRGIAGQPIAPAEAGWRLAHLGEQYTLTLFECFLTDFAGHSQDWDMASRVLQRLDDFLRSLVCHLSSHVTLIITSDHGNLEDLSTKRHTLHPVPLIAIGPQATAFRQVTDLTGIAPALISQISTAAKSSPQSSGTSSM